MKTVNKNIKGEIQASKIKTAIEQRNWAHKKSAIVSGFACLFVPLVYSCNPQQLTLHKCATIIINDWSQIGIDLSKDFGGEKFW